VASGEFEVSAGGVSLSPAPMATDRVRFAKARPVKPFMYMTEMGIGCAI